ncbi:DNA (cytosine-5-)-methyltransferase [Euhalothece natronophila Z-M001]|uniref:Cytosine-specific methyltransferase n=1 Tax=Euhalothece natronophila Z-M001 TaxID=522448 RepID=A0A5B8NPR7_9CHRO|nr:DNA (cytosine-5-)-methyltransferase [Euhalothece natronophila]QDZ40199.1 DNA (cytosine-5-)-methyltransferase [Euhalothece natronophila Z-M001]
MDHSKDYKFIDLFAGIGGFRIALEQLGCECVFSSEWDKFCQQTYLANFNEIPQGDITEIAENDIPDHDLLVGGFPCQPFSIAGVSKNNSLNIKHGFQHTAQGNLFFHIVRILKEKQPRAFILENVKNLLSHNKKQTFEIIKNTLSNELNYQIYYQVINASYVVPQNRQRVFIVGFKLPLEFQFPDFKDQKPKIKDILEPNVPDKYTLSDKLWLYLKNYAKKHQSKGNGFGYGLVNLEGITRTLSARYYKDGSEILVPQDQKNPRRLTPKECSRLMGFPEDFKIPVSDNQAYKQFGNAVVPPVVKDIAIEVIKSIESTRKIKVPNSSIQLS